MASTEAIDGTRGACAGDGGGIKAVKLLFFLRGLRWAVWAGAGGRLIGGSIVWRELTPNGR